MMYNVLLSFPRSGNSWVRYAIEYVSQKPTTTFPKLYHQDTEKSDAMGTRQDIGVDLTAPAIVLKSHWADRLDPEECETLIVLVRDYRECILRNVAARTEQKIKNAASLYADALRFYDNFEGSKAMIYYEDLMLQPATHFETIFNILGIRGLGRADGFLENIPKHKAKSVGLYHCRSVTQGAPNKFDFHASRASQSTVEMIDQEVKSRCTSELYNKYLLRYRSF